MNKHENWIDKLRVFACICVVAFHVFGNLHKDAINVPIFLNIIKEALALFHVPIFFIISGYLFWQRWNCYIKSESSITCYMKSYFNLIRIKTINIGIPYITFSVLYIILSSLFFSDHAMYGFELIATIWKTPVAQYWYLLTLLQLFFIVPIIYYIIRSPWLLLGIAILLRILFLSSAFFNNNLCKNSIYFCMGILFNYIVNIYKISFKKDFLPTIRISLVITFLLYIISKLLETNNLFFKMRDTIFSILFVIEIVLYAYCNYSDSFFKKVCSGLSKYTLHVYLLHTWVTGAARVLLCRLGVYSTWTHCLVGIFMGIGISLIGAYIFKTIPILNIFCEPISTYKEIQNRCRRRTINKNA